MPEAKPTKAQRYTNRDDQYALVTVATPDGPRAVPKAIAEHFSFPIVAGVPVGVSGSAYDQGVLEAHLKSKYKVSPELATRWATNIIARPDSPDRTLLRDARIAAYPAAKYEEDNPIAYNRPDWGNAANSFGTTSNVATPAMMAAGWHSPANEDPHAGPNPSPPDRTTAESRGAATRDFINSLLQQNPAARTASDERASQARNFINASLRRP